MMPNFLVLLVALLGGCAAEQTSSFEKLTIEVNSVVKNQMPLSQAQTALNKLSFQCMQGTSYEKNKKGVVECTRNRNGFLYSCIHRVWLETLTADGAVSNIEIHQPVCASL